MRGKNKINNNSQACQKVDYPLILAWFIILLAYIDFIIINVPGRNQSSNSSG